MRKIATVFTVKMDSDVVLRTLDATNTTQNEKKVEKNNAGPITFLHTLKG